MYVVHIGMWYVCACWEELGGRSKGCMCALYVGRFVSVQVDGCDAYLNVG